MARIDRTSSKRSKPSYFMSIVGVALVLFLLGILGMVIIHASKLSSYFKENIEVQVIIKNNTSDNNAIALKDSILELPYAKSVKYVSKEDAADQFKDDFGEDFISILNYNPLYSSVNFKANASYVNEDSLHVIEKQLLKNPIVQEIYYQETLVEQLDKNLRRVGTIVLVLSVLLGLVVIILIDNTIRLAMFSNRFLIKTMQMVGATRWFIAKPFDKRSIINGLISSVLAIGALLLLFVYAKKQLPQLELISDTFSMVVLFIVMIILGISISLFSTHRSVMRYLKMKLDDLY